MSQLPQTQAILVPKEFRYACKSCAKLLDEQDFTSNNGKCTFCESPNLRRLALEDRICLVCPALCPPKIARCDECDRLNYTVCALPECKDFFHPTKLREKFAHHYENKNSVPILVNKNPCEILISDLIITETKLGSGSYGAVFQGILKDFDGNWKTVAVKQVKLFDSELSTNMKREVSILRFEYHLKPL